jgi:hypothetical protein
MKAYRIWQNNVDSNRVKAPRRLLFSLLDKVVNTKKAKADEVFTSEWKTWESAECDKAFVFVDGMDSFMPLYVSLHNKRKCQSYPTPVKGLEYILQYSPGRDALLNSYVWGTEDQGSNPAICCCVHIIT